jgi:hypothetical protein
VLRDASAERIRDLEAQLKQSSSTDANILQTVTRTVDEVRRSTGVPVLS